MRQFTAMFSLGVVLAFTALIWGAGPRTHPAPNPASLSVSDVMLKVDAKALPAQSIEDRSTVY
ncbi:MAG TPA: hypothetical protein VEF90_15935 [Xanthobacteraceae bacterium]|nr:hypothetical protein [Xanthobacteraceae bacterium]